MLVCRDLSEAAVYAHLTNEVFRSIKSANPRRIHIYIARDTRGPKRTDRCQMQHHWYQGADNDICRALLNDLDEPILGTTSILQAMNIR